jgi:serine/threonine-protein kinase
MLDALKQAAAARVGRLVGNKYELIRVLGVGGMGSVYEALHRITERRVALKLMHPEVTASPDAGERFLVEARAFAAIRHPGIVEVLDADRSGDELYVVFELLEGMDLGAAIVKRRLTLELLLAIMVQVLRALDVAHSKGFVHRDIKPANIFLTRTEDDMLVAKVLDFGIARRVTAGRGDPNLTEGGTILGTPYYMSPEQMAGEAVDGRADVWAVGVVMYFALAGQLPFRGGSYGELLAAMLNRGAAPIESARPEVPAPITSVVHKAIAPRLEDRYASAKEMERAILRTGAAVGEMETRPVSTMSLDTDIVRPRRDVVQRRSAAAPAKKNAPPERHKYQDALDALERETDALRKKKKK